MHFNNVMVAVGTMPFKYEILDTKAVEKAIAKTNVNLKLIPDVDGKPKIAQLAAYNLCDITVKGAWTGPAQIHFVPHVNAPVADLTVCKIAGGKHFIADLTLPYARVMHDYLI